MVIFAGDSLSLTETVIKAMWFAAEKHRHQRRKDPARTPYINHPLNVLHILWFEGGVRDEAVLAAGLLHDTVEDTDTSFEELEAVFGSKIRAVVEEVTDDRSKSSSERKQRQILTAPHASKEAKLVKLADKISNLRDISSQPPQGWSDGRRINYFKWAQKVVVGLRGTNPSLESAFDLVCAEFFALST